MTERILKRPRVSFECLAERHKDIFVEKQAYK